MQRVSNGEEPPPLHAVAHHVDDVAELGAAGVHRRKGDRAANFSTDKLEIAFHLGEPGSRSHIVTNKPALAAARMVTAAPILAHRNDKFSGHDRYPAQV